MADQYLESLGFVLSFLKDYGLRQTEEVLRKEVSLRDFAEEDLPLQGGEHVSPENVASVADIALLELDRADLKEENEVPARSTELASDIESNIPIKQLEVLSLQPRKKTEDAKSLKANKLPWDSFVDDYESMDDVGYIRRKIPNQHTFIENELEINSEDASDAVCIPPSDDGQQQALDSEEESSEEEEDEEDDEEIEIEHEPSPNQLEGIDFSKVFAKVDLTDQIRFGASSSSKDETWDYGPMDIKLVDPVTIPDRHLTRQESKESKPVLSRVESLSSSFKDFDIERSEEEGAPNKSLDASSAESPEVIDFMPSIEAGEATHGVALDLKTLNDSRTSSMDVLPDASVSELSEPELVFPVKASRFKAPGLESEAKENGGFSFPVTPAADQVGRIFSPWPSGRSSNSNMHSDDDAVLLSAAEYADEDYRSKPESPIPPHIRLRKREGDEGENDKEADVAKIEMPELEPPEPASSSTKDWPCMINTTDLSDIVPTEDSPLASTGLLGTMSTPELEVEGAVEDADWTDGSVVDHLEAGSSVLDASLPRFSLDEQGAMVYEYDPEFVAKKYEVFDLKIIHRRKRTGFEETKDFPIRLNDLIAGRYQVMDFLGSAAFSRAVQALDTKTGSLVCLKIIKNNKDYFDQSLDEIKLLKYVNDRDPHDKHGIVRLYDFFYYKEHLFLVCELLRANLYEFQKYNKESKEELYFTNARIQKIARQVLNSLAFLHSLNLIHSDLKPENILIKSYSRCEVKVIDLGSSCFTTDQLSSYVQSRSYRAPEVILGLPYDQKIDVWSLGCILAELSSGYVLFQNDSLATLLARLEGILGPIPSHLIKNGRYAHRYYTRSHQLYERQSDKDPYEILQPKRTSLRHRVPDADEGMLDFISCLLAVDPRIRPTAAQALKHPWLFQNY